MRKHASTSLWTSLWISGGKLWVDFRHLTTRLQRTFAAMWNSSLEHTSYASVEHISIHRPVGKFTSVISDLYTLYTGLKITPTSL